MGAETKQLTQWKTRLFAAPLWIGVTALFVLISGGFRVQYKGNQAAKFLFGLADGGQGYLMQDWLANTKDPLPVFSFLVQVTYQFLNENLFYFFQFILIGVYLYSIFGILDHIYHLRRSKLLIFIFGSLYLISYSMFWPGTIPTTLHYGVAGQDFGFYAFLPNAFLAFLFLSIYQFLKKKPYWALASIVIACYFHTGYLIIGAALVSAYLVLDFFENKDWKRVLRFGSISLALVLPIVIYSYALNLNSTSEQIKAATDFMVNQLIPQHTLVTDWWNEFAFYKLLIVLSAILVARRTKLFPVLTICLLIAAAPTILLFIRPSNAISFLQIWRVSTLAVPLSSAVLIAAGVNHLFDLEENFIQLWRTVIIILLLGLLLVTSYHGLQEQIANIKQEHLQSELALMDFIKDRAESGQQYLVPPDEGLLVSFRTHTGVPILINDSSHVYNAVEVLEWRERYQAAEGFYRAEGQPRCTLLTELQEEYHITHVVVYAGEGLNCDGLNKLYQNDRYLVYGENP